MSDGPRYAIFFVPRAGSRFYRLGSSVLGYDCYTGAAVDFPNIEKGAPNWNELSAAPRRYGFHATLKAPFFLAPSASEEQLVNAVRNFAALGHPVHAFAPVVRLLDGFFAVVPRETAPALDSLAASCTTIFDAFRAPMSPKERAQRVALGLSRGQTQNLDRWGYPFVLSEFTFHMTLTGKVPPSRRQSVLAALLEVFGPRAEEPVAVDQLALVKQNSPESSFRVVSACALESAR